MTRALVIKEYGDREISNAISGAIIDGVNERVIPLDNNEISALRAELARLRDKNGLRAYGDAKRLMRARGRMARKYSTRPVKPAIGAILGVYGLLCLLIAETYTQLAMWNRG